MVRRGLLALALGLLCSAHAARAATFLYLRGEPGDSFGVFAEPYRWLDESNASIEVSQPFSGAYVFRFVHTGSGETWSMSWTTNFGGAFTPGVYENPFYLQAAVNGIFCSVSGSHVVVHDAVIENDTVKSAAIDFELHCDGATQGALFGSLRYRTGDLGCEGAEDGTACDDRDECTAAPSCQAGRCTPSAARPLCPPDTICTVEAPCDPANGICHGSPAAPWGESCDDGNACTLGGHCEGANACVGESLDCDDQSPCTTDSCDALTGCVHTPLAEQCWAIASRSIARLRASGTVRGQHVRCSGTCASGSLQVLLIDGDRYRIPSGTTQCLDGQPFDGADETGTLVPTRHGRTTFALDNLDEIADDLLLCTSARLKSIRRTMSMQPGSASFTGVERVRTKLPEVIPTRLTITSTFNGAPYSVDEPPDFPPFPPGRRPPDCGGGIRVHCKAD